MHAHVACMVHARILKRDRPKMASGHTSTLVNVTKRRYCNDYVSKATAEESD